MLGKYLRHGEATHWPSVQPKATANLAPTRPFRLSLMYHAFPLLQARKALWF